MRERFEAREGDEPTLRFIDPQTRERLALVPDDVLLERSGDTGYPARYVGQAAATYSNFLLRLRPASDVDPRYLWYALQWGYLSGIAASHTNRTTMSNLDVGAYLSARMPVWPLASQRAIADYLDQETAQLDAVILAKRRMAELLQEQSSLAFDCALRGHGFEFPAELAPDWAQYPRPEDWAIMNLSQVLVQLTNGFVGPTRDILVDEGVPYVQSLHVKNGKIDFARRLFYVAQAWHDSRARIHLREEDVLIVQTGDIGQVAVVPPGFGSASCHALQIARVKRDVITGRYLAAFLRSPFGRQSLLSRATGALHPHLEAGIKDIPIVVPPLSIQAIVVAEVERDELRALRWSSVLDVKSSCFWSVAKLSSLQPSQATSTYRRQRLRSMRSS